MIELTIQITSQSDGGTSAKFSLKQEDLKEVELGALSIFVCPKAEEIARNILEGQRKAGH